MIIMCIIYSNEVINDNYGRLQEIFLLKTPMDRRNYFFEIWRKFGRAPCKISTSPAQAGTSDISNTESSPFISLLVLQ
jgi:hypothetical protein